MIQAKRLSFADLRNPSLWIVPVLLTIGLVVVGQVNFLLFHTFSELFAIIISFMMFAVAWPTFSFSRNTILVFLAAGYFWVAVLDIFHTIVYKGMNLLPGADAYLSIDFWMGGRLLEAIVMTLAPALCRRHINHNVLFA
ncbi:MAG: hypothetical protein KAI28_07345, partial [Sphingomonadales bacterium]|nr:hypothetical protein [Sphingomonadales bacterium]